MSDTLSSNPERVLDKASLVLAIIGVAFFVFSAYLIAARGVSPLVLVPSVYASYLGFSRLFVYRAPRDLPMEAESA